MSILTDKPYPDKDEDELALIKSRHFMLGDGKYFLAEMESQRRFMKEQHNLDVELMAKQVRSMRFSAILGVIATLAGAALGAWLQHTLSQRPPQNTPPTTQQQIEPSSEVGRHSKIVLPGQTKEPNDSTSLNQPPYENMKRP